MSVMTCPCGACPTAGQTASLDVSASRLYRKSTAYCRGTVRHRHQYELTTMKNVQTWFTNLRVMADADPAARARVRKTYWNIVKIEM